VALLKNPLPPHALRRVGAFVALGGNDPAGEPRAADDRPVERQAEREAVDNARGEGVARPAGVDEARREGRLMGGEAGGAVVEDGAFGALRDDQGLQPARVGERADGVQLCVGRQPGPIVACETFVRAAQPVEFDVIADEEVQLREQLRMA